MKKVLLVLVTLFTLNFATAQIAQQAPPDLEINYNQEVFVVTVDSLNYLQVLGDFVNYPSAPTDFVGGTSGLYFNISIDRKKAKSTLFFTPKQGEQPVFDIWGNMYVPI